MDHQASMVDKSIEEYFDDDDENILFSGLPGAKGEAGFPGRDGGSGLPGIKGDRGLNGYPGILISFYKIY
jgi:hypothetical protein